MVKSSAKASSCCCCCTIDTWRVVGKVIKLTWKCEETLERKNWNKFRLNQIWVSSTVFTLYTLLLLSVGSSYF